MLVEDDTLLNELYTNLLTKKGYDVVSVKDGETAVEKIKQGSWDLVLLDVVLPGISGFEVFSKITKPTKPSYPIYFLTNLDSNDKDKKQLEQAAGYWIKSNMSPPDFLQKVKEVLK